MFFFFATVACTCYSQSLLDSLILHYTFDGNANDYSGFGHHATVNGAVLTSDRNGVPNSAYFFDGTNDYMVFPNVAKLKPALPVTISFWIKAESLDYRDNSWVATENVYNNYTGITLKSNSSIPGRVDLGFGAGTGAGPSHRRSKASASSFTIGNWHHIAVVVRGALDMDIYIDCVNAGGTYSGTGGNIAYTTADGEIGREHGITANPATRYFWGTMDDLAIWNRALSPSEIVQLCNSGIQDPLSVTCSSTDATCFQDQNGSASVIAAGGIAPYSYSWSNGSTDSINSGIGAGTYSVIVIDANGDSATCSTTVSEPPAITCIIEDTICVVDLDLNNYPHGTMLDNQFQGSGITVTAINSAGKPDVPVVFNSGMIGSTPDPDLEVNIGHLIILPNDTNDSNNDGLVDVPDDNLSGGRLVFDFANCVNINSFQFVDQDDANNSWAWTIDSLGNTIDSVLILNAGDGSVQNVVLNSHCVSTMIIHFNSSGGVGNFNLECPITAGQNGNATLDLTAGGGIPGYTFLWSNGETTEDLNGVPAGTYTVTITDSQGCTSTCSTVIGIPANRYMSCEANIINVSACATGNGEASIVNVSGGTPPYQYLWNTIPPQNTTTATGLSDGNHFIKITDSIGIEINELVVVGKDAEVSANLSIIGTSCFDTHDGEVTVSPTGGAAPYSILWFDGNTSDHRTDLSKGVNLCTVTDAKGCAKVISTFINSPAALKSVATTQPASCWTSADGEFNPNVYGGIQPYSYLWSDGSTLGNRYDLSRGVWTVTVTDANGCDKIYQRWINSPNRVRLNVSQFQNASCDGASDGVLNFNLTGGTTPYSVLWDDGVTSENRSDLARGTHTITITDANGCTAQKSTWIDDGKQIWIEVGATPVSFVGEANGTAFASAGNTVGPYTYSWNTVPVQHSQTATGLSQGFYTVTVTDANGCTRQQTVNVVYNGAALKSTVVENAWKANIYPNPSLENNIFVNLREAKGNNVNLTIFDLLGQTILQSELNVKNNDEVFEINTSSLVGGVYFVKMESENQAISIRWVKR